MDITDQSPLQASFNVRQADFLKLRFGMFIHFNMATYHGVEWVEGYPHPTAFHPGGPIDTDAWADAAVSAGMQYAVLTAKHVSGFCLWDSQTTTYNVMHPDCPYQQDLVGQFVESFKSRGLKVGLYYCWRNPGFGDPSQYKVLPPECDPAVHSIEQQIGFQQKQILELLAKYPQVFYLWNDGLDPTLATVAQAWSPIREKHPGVIASANWWDWSKKGQPLMDIAVTETKHFPSGNQIPGETCWRLEQSWFWKETFHPKEAQDIVAQIDTANHRNANFLLNVAPDRQGKFADASVQVLAEIGKLRSRSCQKR